MFWVSIGVEKTHGNRANTIIIQLLSKIDKALKRIEEETYGFCDETGEPIGLDRLEARPIATLTIEAQERREQLERQYGDR